LRGSVGANREMYKGSHVKEHEDEEEELGPGLVPATRSFSKINSVWYRHTARKIA
jgi:hypothetical protein